MIGFEGGNSKKKMIFIMRITSVTTSRTLVLPCVCERRKRSTCMDHIPRHSQSRFGEGPLRCLCVNAIRRSRNRMSLSLSLINLSLSSDINPFALSQSQSVTLTHKLTHTRTHARTHARTLPFLRQSLRILTGNFAASARKVEECLRFDDFDCLKRKWVPFLRLTTLFLSFSNYFSVELSTRFSLSPIPSFWLKSSSLLA